MQIHISIILLIFMISYLYQHISISFIFSSFLWIILISLFLFIFLFFGIFFYLFQKNGKEYDSEKQQHIISNEKIIKNVISDSDQSVWLNVILKKIVKHITNGMDLKKRLQILIDESKSELPEFLGEIKLDNVSLGKSIPLFKNIKAKEIQEELYIEFEIYYEDKDAILSLNTELILNHPLKNWASLPIQFSIENIYFKSKVRLKIKNFKELKISLLEPPEYDLIFKNEIGNKLKNIPKITEWINHLLNITIKKFLSPNEITIQMNQ